MYPQHNPYPYRPLYNPTNPMGRGAKIALAVLGVGVAGTALYLVWPSEAKAADRPLPSVKPSKGKAKRPSGSPPPQGGACMPSEFGGKNSYDAAFWNSAQKILESFDFLGYTTPTDRPTMNRLGGDGKLGGGDDLPNAEVTRFQRDYNKVSRGGKLAANMRGLDPDGKVGPCTLNGMKYVMDNLAGENWTTVVQQAG